MSKMTESGEREFFAWCDRVVSFPFDASLRASWRDWVNSKLDDGDRQVEISSRFTSSGVPMVYIFGTGDVDDE